MQSKAATVEQYLASLPPDRRTALEAVRKVILENIDADCEEGMAYGMIGYAIPHRVYPAGYHCDPKMPLPYAGLASQKGQMSVYLSCQHGSESDEAWCRKAWAKTGKRLDMGKACIRFKKLEDLALEVLAEAIRRMPSKAYIARYEQVLAQSRAARTSRSVAKPPAKSAKAAPRTKAAPKPRAASPKRKASPARRGQAR